MIPVGYLYKRVASKRDWLRASTVDDVYSLSACISDDFADYINYWKHNGYWLFDSPAAIHELVSRQHLDLAGTTLFYYEAHEYEFDQNTGEWTEFAPEPALVTAVQAPPPNRQLEDFDVTTFSVRTAPASRRQSPVDIPHLHGPRPDRAPRRRRGDTPRRRTRIAAILCCT